VTFPEIQVQNGLGIGVPHNHAVQFYEGDAFLAASAGAYLAEGLVNGDPAIVIATPSHKRAIMAELRRRGIDWRTAVKDQRLVVLDARDTLATFMSGESPDPNRFDLVVGGQIRKAGEIQGAGRVRAYGEMVDLLWTEGKSNAAILLERLWNDLISRYELSLLCAYAMDGFQTASHQEGFRAVCDSHTHVLPTESYAALSTSGQLREITLLQQRARALETELAERARLEAELHETLTSLKAREAELSNALENERGALADALKARQDADRARRAAEQANRVKSEFLAVMSHELRTPLNAIGGYAELMELGVQGPVSNEQRELLERIQRNQRHLLGLINQVLNYARIETGNLRFDIADIPLNELLGTTEALIFPQLKAKALKYRYSGCAESVTVRADPDKLQQILLNLLANAVKFTERGGMISVAAVSDADEVKVRVTDTGIGIARDKLVKIFEPFVQADPNYTREYEGVGLGLAVSRDLAKGMNATLEVESEAGRGATFTLTLQRGAGQAAESAETADG
jgi:signal transduction histidine kinase